MASARAHTHTCALWVWVSAFPHTPNLLHPPQRPWHPRPWAAQLPLPSFSAANSCPTSARATLPPAPPPRGPEKESCPRSTIPRNPMQRQPLGMLGRMTDPGAWEPLQSQGSPMGWAVHSPNSVRLSHSARSQHLAAEGASRWPYLAWGGSEPPKTWWWRARAGRAAPSATWPPAWFHQGDPNPGGQSQPAGSPRAPPPLLPLARRSPCSRRGASAASGAAAPAPGRPV